MISRASGPVPDWLSQRTQAGLAKSAPQAEAKTSRRAQFWAGGCGRFGWGGWGLVHVTALVGRDGACRRQWRAHKKHRKKHRPVEVLGRESREIAAARGIWHLAPSPHPQD